MDMFSGVNAVSSSGTTAGGSTTKVSSPYSTYGSTQFMQMLMAQLSHQNPLEPVNDSDMMSQMAQLNSLSELQNLTLMMEQLAVSNQASYAASLIGKTVSAALSDGTSVEGKVTGVSVEGGTMYLTVNDKEVPLGSVTSIKGE